MRIPRNERPRNLSLATPVKVDLVTRAEQRETETTPEPTGTYDADSHLSKRKPLLMAPTKYPLHHALGAATIALVISCAFGDRFWPITVTGNLWLLAAIVDDIVLERQAGGA